MSVEVVWRSAYVPRPDGRSYELFERLDGVVDLPFRGKRLVRVTDVDAGVELSFATGHALLVPWNVTVKDATLALRAIAHEKDSCRWPSALQLPPTPWPDDTLAVLGDTILEAGHDVGRRLSSRTPGEDAHWLGVFGDTGEHWSIGHLLDVRWRAGVADELVFRASTLSSRAFTAALAQHAVTRLTRSLILTSAVLEVSAVDRLLGCLALDGAWPRLESLCVGFVLPEEVLPLNRRLAGLSLSKEAFPHLRPPFVATRAPLLNRALVEGVASVGVWLSEQQLVVEVAERVQLNERVLAPAVYCLMPGDEVVIDGAPAFTMARF